MLFTTSLSFHLHASFSSIFLVLILVSLQIKKHIHAQYFDRFLIIDTITNFYRIKGYLHKKTSNYDTRNWRFNFQHNNQIIDCECRSYFYFSKVPIRMWLRK